MANPISIKPNSGSIVGGVFSAAPPSLVDGQGCVLQVDAAGNLLTNVAATGSGMPVKTSDFLHVQNSGIFSGFNETLNYRIVDSSGVIHDFSTTFSVNSANGGAAGCTGGVAQDGCGVQIPVAGTLVSASVSNSSFGSAPGSNFFQLFLLNSDTAGLTTSNIAATLISNYLDNSSTVYYPGGQSVVSVQTLPQGSFVWGVGLNPAAGADFSCSPLTTGNCSQSGGNNFGNARIQLDSVRFTLTTSATVATRQLEFQITNGTDIWLQIPAIVTQTAGLTVNYQFCSGCQNSSADTSNIVTGLPNTVVVDPGFSATHWNTKTTNIQTGDQISKIEFLVRQWGSW